MANKQDRDKHIRRNGDDYAGVFMSLLPQGQAWPKGSIRRLDDGSLDGSTLARTCYGLSQYWGKVDQRAADLLEIESDPRKASESHHPEDGLLADWERAFGLPDLCFPTAGNVDERRRMLVLHMTWLGAQSRQYFIDLMAWLGYGNIEIEEFSPFMAGISQVGDTRPEPRHNFRWYIGPAEQRFVWTVSFGHLGVVWFRAAAGQAGVDTHVKFVVPDEVQCLLERWKPAHTDVQVDLTPGDEILDPMQGTP